MLLRLLYTTGGVRISDDSRYERRQTNRFLMRQKLCDIIYYDISKRLFGSLLYCSNERFALKIKTNVYSQRKRQENELFKRNES